MDEITEVTLDKALFRDHLPFWRQLLVLDPGQRGMLWASIQRQALREIGMDYAWDSDQPVPVLPRKEDLAALQEVSIDMPGHYL